MTVQSVDGSRSHVPVMALGVSRLGQALPAVRGLTAAGDLQRVLAANAQAVVSAAGEAKAEITARQVREQHEASRTRWQRTFGVSRNQQAQEQEEIREAAEAAAVRASLVAAVGVQGAQWALQRWDRHGSARVIRRVIGFAALGPDGKLTDASEVIYDGAMQGMGVSGRARKRMDSEPLPRSVADLRGCALQEPLLSAVTTIAFSAMAAATDTDEAVHRMPALLLRLGMPQPTAEAATHTAMNEYLSTRMLLTDHYQVLQFAIAGIALQFRLPTAQIAAAIERVIACNPYEQARQANRREVAALVTSGARLAALHLGTPIGPALSIAVSAAGHLFARPALPPSPQLAGAFQAYAATNGLPPEEIQQWARGEYH